MGTSEYTQGLCVLEVGPSTSCHPPSSIQEMLLDAAGNGDIRLGDTGELVQGRVGAVLGGPSKYRSVTGARTHLQ